MIGHLQAQGIVGVQDRRVPGNLDRHALDLGKLFKRIDTAQAEVIGRHVQARRDIALLETETAAQHAAARGLHHRCIDGGIAQDHLCGYGPCHIARHGELAVDVDTVGRGQPDRETGHLQYVREHARRGRLPVGAGDGRDRDTARRIGREQHVDDGACHVARRSLAWRNVHAETRARVDFADAAAGLAVGLADVLGQEIHAADVEIDSLDGADGHLAVVRVNHVGDVDRGTAGRQVCRRPQVHDFVFLRHGRPVVAGLGQQPLRLVIELEARQHFFMADAATRVLVHDVYELLDRVLAIADDMARHTLGRRNKLTIDDEQAMIETLDVTLDNDRPSVLAGFLETDLDLFTRAEIDRNAAAMVTGKRLEHDRVADTFCGSYRLRRGAHEQLFRHGQP